MTPEELNRTIEFIIQSQARLASAQEQDRVDRLEAEKELKAFDRRLAGLLEIQYAFLKVRQPVSTSSKKKAAYTMSGKRRFGANSWN